jgi:predicted aspartyl protease
MEAAAMGKVLVTAKVENMEDLWAVKRGLLQPEQVRSVEVHDALVDTGASTLSLPKSLVAQLGLHPGRVRHARTSGGSAKLQMYGVVRLTIQDREWFGDVCELPDDCPMLIGQLPLEGLDFVVDPIGQRLIGNPAHGGEQMIELY